MCTIFFFWTIGVCTTGSVITYSPIIFDKKNSGTTTLFHEPHKHPSQYPASVETKSPWKPMLPPIWLLSFNVGLQKPTFWFKPLMGKHQYSWRKSKFTGHTPEHVTTISGGFGFLTAVWYLPKIKTFLGWIFSIMCTLQCTYLVDFQF